MCCSGVILRSRNSRIECRYHAASTCRNVSSSISSVDGTPITSAPNVPCSGRNSTAIGLSLVGAGAKLGQTSDIADNDESIYP
jgi:hypothetical protein